jgi:hypothetical protein
MRITIMVGVGATVAAEEVMEMVEVEEELRHLRQRLRLWFKFLEEEIITIPGLRQVQALEVGVAVVDIHSITTSTILIKKIPQHLLHRIVTAVRLKR